MLLREIALMGNGGHSGQDGALYGDVLFRFDAKGNARAYDARVLDQADGSEKVVMPEIASFTTNPADPVVPHFNAVVFGPQRWEEGDEFPLLYANLYNNYASAPDRREGVLCAYRLQRAGDSFAMTLVQVIRVGFVKDPLWCSEDGKDVRPYGNFVIDGEGALLHAFVMRDTERVTRYFTFALPDKGAGEADAFYGVPTVTLGVEDVTQYFDTPYHNYIQGACCHGGLIYSSEGFNEKIHPALRVIDPAAKGQLAHIDLVEHGYTVEAEWIDFRGERCIYTDAHGLMFEVEFDF